MGKAFNIFKRFSSFKPKKQQIQTVQICNQHLPQELLDEEKNIYFSHFLKLFETKIKV